MTVIVPIFNEVDNLDRIERAFQEYLPQASIPSKVLLIDDGSTDGSFQKIEAVCIANPDFEYIQFVRNFGLSTAIKAGIDHCETDLFGYIDADLQTTPFDFEKLLAHIDEYAAVIGFRAKRKDSLSKKLQSWIANTARRAIIDDGIIDTGCPLKVIHTGVAKNIPFFNGMHRFVPALIQLQGGKVKQVNVRHFERIAGKSKFNLLNRSVKPLQDAVAYRWMRSRYIHYEIQQTKLIK
jgi:glycosyltransferase involved in cell wall biosynthesis